MDALYYEKELLIKDIPEPEVEDPYDVKIKISMAGICGTDLTVVREKISSGHVLGHEAIGKVIAVGNKVKMLQVGDLVVVNPNEHCGACDNCKNGLYYLCSGSVRGDLEIVGLNKQGVFSEFFKTRECFVEKIPSHLSMEKKELFLLVEPLACVLQGIEKLNTNDLKRILIIGQGTMGYLATKILLRLGHKVDSVDLNENKVKNLCKTNPNCFSTFQDIEGKFDIIIDAVGNQFEISYPFLKNNGEFLVLGLYPEYKLTVNAATLVQRNQKIIASSEYTSHFHIAKRYLEKFLDIEEDIFSRYHLMDFDKAFFEENSYIKRVFIFED